MYALNIDSETNRILSATYPKYAPKDAIIVDALPEGNMTDYLYVDGEYVYAPLPKTDNESYTAEDMLNALVGGMRYE